MTVRNRSSRIVGLSTLLALIALAALSTVACASRGRTSESTSLADLRRRALDRPTDTIARRDRALAELVAPGGDFAVADRETLALARELADDVRVRFARASITLARGEFRAALRDLLAVIDLGRSSADPLAGPLAELAVARAIAIRDEVDGFAAAFPPVVRRVAENPGRLGPEAAFHVVETAIRYARERGLDADESAWVAASGCVTRWTVVGPFGPLPMLRFDDTFAVESGAPLAGDYDLGPGRGRRANYTVRARGCAANIGQGRQDTGVFFAATDVVVDHDVDAIVHVETPNVFDVIVDAVRVGRLDGRVAPTGTALAVPVHLRAGRHTLRVKLASRFSNPLLIAAITDARGRPVARFDAPTSPANPDAPAVPAAASDLVRAGLERPADPFVRWAAALFASNRHNAVDAREMLRGLATPPNAAPLTVLAWAALQTADPFTPAGVARDRARRGFETLVQRRPEFVGPHLSLAAFAAEDGRDEEALRRLREAATRFGDHPSVLRELASRLIEREWWAEATDVVERARQVLPQACWPRRLRMAVAQSLGQSRELRQLADELRACDAITEEPAQVAQAQRRWDDAEREFERLAQHDPAGRSYPRALFNVQRDRGAVDRALERSASLLVDNPVDSDLRADVLDLLLAANRESDAMRLLDREIAADPESMSQLFRLRAALGNREELAAWRLDGRGILQAFERSGQQYDAAAVLVLDYTVRRVFADGSALELTHNIVRLQSQEGVDEHATFNPPEGAFILGLRTHKADGRILEPDAIARLDAIAFPDVHIGDAIEFEYVRGLGASNLAPNGFASERFFFRGFDVPYDRSEYVVVVPRAMADRMIVDPRGAAPRTERRELGGALSEFRWVARQSHRMTPEQRSVAGREFIPSIAVGADASWSHLVDALRDRFSDMNPYDPNAETLMRTIIGRATAPSERLRRLHRWVLENVQQEGAGTPFGSAPVMLSARRGHRTRVLRYLLGLAGVSSQIALVRPVNGDQTPSDLADDDTFGSLLLIVQTEQGARWVTASERGAPVSWLPLPLYGQEAIVLAPGAPRARVTPFDSAAHTRAVQVHLTLDRDGRGRFESVERMSGTWSVQWRESLRQIDRANLNQEFEAYLGRLVTAASLQSVNIVGQTDNDADVVLTYAFTAPGVAVRAGGGLEFEGVYHAELGPAYVPVPRRTTPQFNAEGLNATLDVRVDVPAGMHVPTLPARREGHAPGVDWSFAFEPTATGFRVLRALRIPPGRVSAADYPRFSAEIRAADAADAQRVRIVPR